MNALNIYLADGTYDGAVVMQSPASSISTVRVERNAVSDFMTELDEPGIYLLLIGTDSVYVGQSGLQSVYKRILNPHSGSIDSSWHTVVGFMINKKIVSSNEYLYIENAMCEYAHTHFSNCLTTTPSKVNCNSAYRKSHYKLSSGQIHSCDQYLADIQFYLSCFIETVFPAKFRKPTVAISVIGKSNTELFYLTNPKRDVDAKADIQVHLGHTKSRQAVVKAGSKVSVVVSDSFSSLKSVKARRKLLEKQGKLVNYILQEDIVFDSQSGAGAFVNGTSCDGNVSWKRVSDNLPLKNLL